MRALPVVDVYPNPDQPRKLFDQEALEELAASIKAHGLLQPIKVRADGTGGYMIVCGERRWRAHKLLGAETILAVVESLSDDDLADAAIVENLQRRNITPLEEARAFQARLDAGLTVEELAARLGIRQPWRITERTNLLRLDPTYQDAFAKGILTPSQATEMSRLTKPFQRLLFEAISEGRCRTYQELRAVTAALLSAEKRGVESGTFRLGAPDGEQVDLFKVAEPTPEEKQVVRRMEQKIEAVEELLRGGFKDNEVVICNKVSRANAEVMAERLELIEKQLAKLRLALRAHAVAGRAA